MRIKLSTDKKSPEELSVLNIDEEDEQSKENTDELAKKKKEDEVSRNEKPVVHEEDKLATFRQQVLFWVFLENCLEVVVTSAVTLLAIKWMPLRRLVEENFWPLEICIFVSLFARNPLYRIKALTSAPGCFLPKLVYLLTMISLHLLLAIHFPKLLDIPSLSPYFSVLAAAATAATYTLIYILAFNGKVNVENNSLYWWGLVVPAYALLSIQPAYFLFRGSNYNWLMINICSAMFIAVMFSYENIYFSKRFVKSSKLEEIAMRREGEISLLEAGRITVVIHRQPIYYQKEIIIRDNENV